MKRPQFMGIEAQARTCGRTACENDAIAFWQSRMTVAGQRADPIALADIPALARSIRAHFNGPASDTPNPQARNPSC